jgi:WD40 repeat protein
MIIIILDVNVEAYEIVVKDDKFYVGKRGTTSQLEKYSATTRTLQLVYAGHRGTVFTVLLWEDLLFSGSADTKIICWDEGNGQIIRSYDHTSAVQVLAIFNNNLFSAGLENNIVKWNIESGIIEKTFPNHHGNNVWCLAFEEGSLYSGSLDTTVIRWDLNTSSRKFTYFGRDFKLRSVVLWKNLVIAGGDGSTLIIQDKSQNSLFPVEIISGHLRGIICMTVLNDTIFTGGVDSTIRRRSLIDNAIIIIYYGIILSIQKTKIVGHTDSVAALYFDEKFLYSGSLDSTVKRWNISTGSIDKEYFGHTKLVWTLSIREVYLYSGSVDSSVRVWDKEKAIQVDLFRCKFFSKINCLVPTQVVTIVINGENLIVGAYEMFLVSLSTGQILASQTGTKQKFWL